MLVTDHDRGSSMKASEEELPLMNTSCRYRGTASLSKSALSILVDRELKKDYVIVFSDDGLFVQKKWIIERSQEASQNFPIFMKYSDYVLL